LYGLLVATDIYKRWMSGPKSTWLYGNRSKYAHASPHEAGLEEWGKCRSVNKVLVSLRALLVTFTVTTVKELLPAAWNGARIRTLATMRLFVAFYTMVSKDWEEPGKCMKAHVSARMPQ
jgi:hypothetical protein